MFHQLCHLQRILPKHLFISSAIAFIILNIIENFIHYNIGRSHQEEKVKLEMPNFKDWIKIIVVMIIFAILQGLFTLILYKTT